MYVDSKLIKARAANPSNLIVKHRFTGNNFNKGKAILNHEERVFIGGLAKISGSHEVARQFDVSQIAALNFSKGMISPREVDPKLQKDVEKSTKTVTDVISDRALNTLTSALGLVDDRLSDPKRNEGIKTVDIAKIAKDMSTIHSNMRGKDSSSGLNFGMQIILHAPVQKTVRDFEVVND